MRRKAFWGLAGAALLGATVVSAPSYATGATAEGSAAACSLSAGSVTAAGAHTTANVTATTPPSKGELGTTPGAFPAGQVRLSSTSIHEPSVGGTDSYGYVVRGDSLYYRFYNFNEGSNISTRIGGGWTNFTAFEVSQYDEGPNGIFRNTAYGLRTDGTLLRWSVGKAWKATGSAPGFASVKSMALISKTRTYDTFLANTRGGALYTLHIPTSAPMKPVVKLVRSRTWQGFDKLIANKCGQFGTILLGIDKDTRTGYRYAVGRANGTATVINSLGPDGRSFKDPVYFRWGTSAYRDPLTGE